MAPFPKLPPSGITVVIVGAGFAGLGAAIECDRKGHHVILLEKSANIEEVQQIGDIITFDPNGSKLFKRWPGVWDALKPIVRQATIRDLYAWTGELVTQQSYVWENENWGQSLSGHRGDIHSIIYKHAEDRGIDIRLGCRVTDYFEDETEAGVAVKKKSESGEVQEERITGDVVFAAEGARSPGRKIVLGFEDWPKSSGYAVYRAWFGTEDLAKNEITRHLVTNGDWMGGWIGPDIHFLASCLKDGKDFNWAYTHRDEADIAESWQFPGSVPEALKNVEGWAPIVKEIIKATPPGRLIDHKLVYRDTLPTFVSPRGRIALIGDAAHPFLPTSIQGAGQALEDGATLAVCLELCGGRGEVTKAVRAYEKIRYERVRDAQAQLMGLSQGNPEEDITDSRYPNREFGRASAGTRLTGMRFGRIPSFYIFSGKLGCWTLTARSMLMKYLGRLFATSLRFKVGGEGERLYPSRHQRIHTHGCKKLPLSNTKVNCGIKYLNIYQRLPSLEN